jgi:hypothetical protein
MEHLNILIMYRGYELVPVRSDERWQVQIFSGGKLITTTMLCATEDSAMAEAKKDVDGFRSADDCVGVMGTNADHNPGTSPGRPRTVTYVHGCAEESSEGTQGSFRKGWTCAPSLWPHY